jgi:hypothetical protein
MRNNQKPGTLGALIHNSRQSVGDAHAEGDAKIVCQQCQTAGYVTTKRVMAKKGLSGGKAAGAVLTGGLSILATGLSRKETVTQATCSNCRSTWVF